MKRCPQCGAEYDDYVQYCFVDGAELVEASAAPPAPVPVPVSAPPPAPVAPAATPMSAAAARPVPVAAPRPLPQVALRPVEPAPPPRTMPVWALLMVLLMLITAFGFVSIAGALLMIGGGGDKQVAAPGPAQVAPVRPPPPTPVVPRPAASATIQVEFESDPPGATIYEGEQQLCTTPCRVPHPEYAPPERTFVLKLEGAPDTTYTMTDPSQIQRVKLSGGSSRAAPKPGGRRTGNGEDILLGR